MKHPDEDRGAEPSPELQRLILGEITPDSEEARRLFAADPALRVEFESFQHLQQRLTAAGAHEADKLSSLTTTEAEARAARETLAALWDEQDGQATTQSTPAPRRLPGWVWTAGLAAAACLVLAVWWFRDDAALPDRPYLGPEDRAIELVAPLGEVDSLEVFRWRANRDLEADQSFTLVIRGDPGTVLRIANLTAMEHRLTPEERETLGETTAVRWQVVLVDAFVTDFLASSDTHEAYLRDR